MQSYAEDGGTSRHHSTQPSTRAHDHFAYYDQHGKSLGESSGAQPQNDLYLVAHYVVVNRENMIKNNDSKEQITADLTCCENDLLHTPLSNMSEILYLNRLINALRNCLANA